MKLKKSTANLTVQKKFCSTLLSLTLVACGGGGDSTTPESAPAPLYSTRLMVQPADRLVAEPAYNASIEFSVETDPAKSVFGQSLLPGTVVLTAGPTRTAGFADFSSYLQEALKYPNIRYTYLYDELFWTGSSIAVGKDEAETLAAAKLSHAAGLKTVVSILPYVVLDPAFALADSNAFDVIALDLYPSMAWSGDHLGGCKYNDNLQTNLLYCSIQKLRSTGFKGEIWYVYQAFGMNTRPFDTLKTELAAQRDTIAAAPGFGVTGLVPFGLYLTAEQIAQEPYLFQGQGSAIESLVRY